LNIEQRHIAIVYDAAAENVYSFFSGSIWRVTIAVVDNGSSHRGMSRRHRGSFGYFGGVD